jgi:hypothetical protein
MTDTFTFNQGTDGVISFAGITIPGCGRNEKDTAPVVMVERTKDGDIKLLVYGDILSKHPTHEISLNGAKLEKKEVTHASTQTSPVPTATAHG